MNNPLLEHLASGRILVLDGAMGTTLQRIGKPEDYRGKVGCHEAVVLYYPPRIEEVHREFLSVGVDAVETCTFGGNLIKLAEFGLEKFHDELNADAAIIARRACRAVAGERYVLGSIGPSGFLPGALDPELSKMKARELEEIFYRQARALIEGEVDGLICETAQDLLELRAQLLGARRAVRESGREVAVICQASLDLTGRMLLGTDLPAAFTALQLVDGLGPDVFGLNCSTGPEPMADPLRALVEIADRPISVLPNAGLPTEVDGHTVYPLEPVPFAEAVASFVDRFGVQVVGGCCGTTPEHLKQLVERVRHKSVHAREPARPPRLTGGLRSIELRQDITPLIVGERLNAQGSKKAKELMLEDDLDGLVKLGRDQIEGGAHALDVCLAMTERAGEPERLTALVRRLAASVDAPLFLDSTDADAIELALENSVGRGVVNSVHYESGEARCARVLPLVKRYGQAVLALTIDETGMATTADRKVAVAERFVADATGKYGLKKHQLFIDPLTFTLATGEAVWRKSAVETLEGIARIKKAHPELGIVLGVSNVSFGLMPAGRRALNSAFLYHAQKAGLDAAIVNSAGLVPRGEMSEQERALCDDLLFDRREDALPRFIEHYSGVVLTKAASTEIVGPAPARIHRMIVERRGEKLVAAIDEALLTMKPVAVLNEVLLPAMKDVGDKFGTGELILPFVLQSAELMKKAVAHIEPLLDKDTSTSRGRMVLATVFGDVHDIGKSLVKTILSNNGYEVHDLGKQVPVGTILEKAIELKADAIGLSALLVSTSKQMELAVGELKRRGLTLPLLIGGAAINRKFGARIAVSSGGLYEGGVFYCKDAFEGLDTMGALADPAKKADLWAKLKRDIANYVDTPRAPAPSPTPGQRSSVKPVPCPAPPESLRGVHSLRAPPLDDVWKHLDLRELYKLQWGVRSPDKAEYERMVKDIYAPQLEKMKAEVKAQKLFDLQAVYGCFTVKPDGDALTIGGEKFTFTRQPDSPWLSLADYFADGDWAAMQVVTCGQRGQEAVDALRREGRDLDAFYLHGLLVETAEAFADWMHARLRKEWLGAPGRGKRYSPGYPAWPDLVDQQKVWRLLDPVARIGVRLTEADQMEPEASTSALVVHHPEASYFSLAPHGRVAVPA